MLSSSSRSPLPNLVSKRTKIRFDTDLVLIRLLDHLSPNGTNGERCSKLMDTLEEYKEMKRNSTHQNSINLHKRLPPSLFDMDDPYSSVQQLLDIYLECIDEHDMTMSLIKETSIVTPMFSS